MKAAVGAVGLVLVLACEGVEGDAVAIDEPESTTSEVVAPAGRAHRPQDRGRALDVTADGFADVAIGAPSQQATFVYFGGPTGIAANPSATLVGEFEDGSAVAPAGDVNGDGFGDLVVGSGINTATVYLGSAAGINPTGIALHRADALRFGATVSTAGDVNGDRFDDVIVGTRYGAMVYLGNAGGVNPQPAFLLTGPGSAALTVVGGTDFNRDGFGDVVVGSGNIGVAVYMGSAAGLTASPQLTLAGSGGAAAAGDVDGDRHSDLLVATADDGVHVYLGGPRGLRPTRFATIRDPAGGAGFGDPVGGTMSTAGDVNGDGFADVVIGTIFDDRAYLFLGGRRGLAPAPVRTWTGAAGSGFGAAVGGVGDTNGDGFGDIIIGARTAGQAFVFPGGATGPAATPALTLTGPPRFGEAVAKMTR